MYYGDDILILENGLRIRPKALHPIGITHRSQCWGVEIVSAPDKNTPPHLLVSAFSPQNWHILFRVEVELRDRVGSMSKAAKILEQHDFNILATQCAPSGHNHATWHIIGEALDRKKQADEALKESIVHFKPSCGAFDERNNEFREKLTERFSVPSLKYSRELENVIETGDKQASEEGKFLHPRFVEHNTLLYKNLEQFFLEEKAEFRARVYEHELYRAVESRWLQQMAVFRSYSQARQKEVSDEKIKSYATWDSPILFKYDARKSLLEPLNQDDKNKYLQVIKTCAARTELPIKAIVAFNHEEHYLRIVLPERENRKKRVSIQLDYITKFDGHPQKSSIGLLKEIAGILEKNKVNLNYVSNTMTILTQDREEGSISLIGTPDKNVEDEAKLIGKIESSLKNIDDKKDNVSFSETKVNKIVGAKGIFISTRFDFAFGLKPTFREKIENLTKQYGFEPVWGDPQKTLSSQEEDIDSLSKIIVNRIQNSHAFLQILPKELPAADWLLFELGVARGANLPYVICVDKSKLTEYPPKVANGSVKYDFNSDEDASDIVNKIEAAIIMLAKKVYDTQR